MLGFVAAAGLAAAAPLEAALTIEHQAVGCVLADSHPRLQARFDPVAQVGRARVFFRASGTPHWYSVEMAAQAGLWTGVLPKPKRSTSGIEYYLEVTDRAFAPSRTAQQAAVVVAGPLACKDAPLAAVSASERVVVSAAAGAPPVPAGFLDAGLLAAGGGLSTTALVGIIGGGAVVGGAVAVGRGGDKRPEERPLRIAGSWVGTGADGLSRDVTETSAPPHCHREDDLFLELQQSGNVVSGNARYVSRAGTNCNLEPLGTVRTFTVTGTLDGSGVSLTLLPALPEGPSTHVFTGTLQGSRMSGTVASTFPGGGYRGTWSVRRP
jgi:hypothetical protein